MVATIGDISYVSTMTVSTFQLASELGSLLLEQNTFVTAAESCTGGGVASAITDVPGSSAWFEGGVVVYSNRLKHELLAVPERLIEAHGAVSEAVVLAMLDGVLNLTHSKYGMAVSGIAGPDGGSPGKPVGTVCVAAGTAECKQVHTYIFEGQREAVREQSISAGLRMLIEEVRKTKNTV